MNEEHQKSSFRKGLIAGILMTAAIAAVVFACLGTFGKSSSLFSSSDEVLTSDTKTKLETLEALVSKYYLHDYTTADMQNGLYEGLINGLGDKYTVYYDEEETKALNEMTSGTYSGIGAVLSQDKTTGVITILTVYKDSPAEEAGIQNGDILYKVDGTEVTNRDLTDVVKDIKGEEGTDVKLTLYRDSTEVEVTAVRRSIEIQTVDYEMKDGSIGYIKVSEFEEVTLDQFKAALSDLEGQGMKGLVIDLRDNPGGNVDTVCDMLDQLLPKGLIVYTQDKNGKITNYNSAGDDTFGLPLTVLVNGNSASASEIFAGAVQDRQIGTVVGTTTYGKGVVQSIIDLQDGTSLKVTIAEYYTPNGRNIDGIGITPDVEVENDTSASADGAADAQLDKALEIIRNAM